ncbi:MAG: hypothetical protein HY318_09035 [Armatimonadetes bacterium]|nr:hypothetical protein [Armatimonadota bacterium]
MKTLFRLFAFLSLCVLLVPEGALAAPLVLKRAGASPVIDGKTQDESWSQADKRPLQEIMRKPLRVGGQVAMCYDDKNLYVAFWLDEPEPAKIKAEKGPVNGPAVWQGEVLEWFINPAGDGNDYVQLGWNPAGSKFNAKCHASAPGAVENDLSWSPKWHVASVIGKKGWTSESAISFAELGRQKPEAGTMWTMNLGRTRQIGERVFSSLSPTVGSFHNPDRFMEVWFAQYVPPKEVVSEKSGPPQVLIGCHDSGQGYDALLEARVQLDRAFGEDNVQIRTGAWNGPMIDWARKYQDLQKFSLVVLANVSPTAFTPEQVDDLARYVREGGGLITAWMTGVQTYSPKFTTWNWMNTPLKDLLPVEASFGEESWRRIEVVDTSCPVFKGLPADQLTVFIFNALARLQPEARVLAASRDPEKSGETPVPFLTEKRSGKGIVVDINVLCGQGVTVIPVSNLKESVLYSPYYPLLWDNLVEYVTGKKVPTPAKTPVAPEAKPHRPAFLSINIGLDNLGEIFRPDGKIRLPSPVKGKAAFPYEATVLIESADGKTTVPAGAYTITDASQEILVSLPYLDRGEYVLRVDLNKDGSLVDSARDRFWVALPLISPDEFNFGVYIEPAYCGESDSKRIARDLTSIGFTQLKTIGGITYAGYRNSYRFFNEARFVSWMEEAGLRFRPVWYPLNLEVMTRQPSKDPDSPTPPAPEPNLPGKQFLPWGSHWMQVFGDKVFGRMPLTDGYNVNDEFAATTFPLTEAVQKGFEALAGMKAPANATQPGFYDFLNYRFKIAADFCWFGRAMSEACNPSWMYDSILTPNSFSGHSSCMIDVPMTASALGVTGPDEYHYGEPKLYQKSLSSMAVVWSGTDFGRLARPAFTGGQLANVYYEDFPEQVFAALSGGAREFSVFYYGTASFEEHGRQNKRFAAIAKKTTADAARLGRTLNHYDRSRARVAMLYPQTAYVLTSMSKEFNPDYLKMTGTSAQYLDLTYGVQLEFDLLRRMFGQVDILFDEQIRRGALRDYDLLVVAYAREVEERTLREIRRFAEGGGTLLLCTDSARSNEKAAATGTLYELLPVAVGEARTVQTDYSETRMSKPAEWSIGNALTPKPGAEVLFSFPDKAAACVRCAVGRGEAFVLGLPLAGLKAAAGQPWLQLLQDRLSQRAQLVSRPDDGEFSAITFVAKRDHQRLFMVANHNKKEARTRVVACGDADEGSYALADIVTGEKIPFKVAEGLLSFEVSCPDRWGRALALLKEPPANVEVSVSGPATPRRKFMLAVRLLGRDGQPTHATLPFDLTITDPEGKVREDLSGVRVVEQGVYVFAMEWPVAAKKGQWTVTASEKISGHSDSATWEAQ